MRQLDIDPDYEEVGRLIRGGRYAEAVEMFEEHRARFQSARFKLDHYKTARFKAHVPNWGLSPEKIDAIDPLLDHPFGAAYIGANLVAYQKSAHFLFDSDFVEAVGAPEGETGNSRHRHIFGGAIWNHHVKLTTAFNALHAKGDFVECGTYTGATAAAICKFCDFGSHPEKTFYLYDLFQHLDGDTHTPLPGHNDGLYEKALEKFRSYPNVRVIRGRIPEIFGEVIPDKIAFLHIDMNDPVPELWALVHLYDRMVPGGVILWDDYGHVDRQDQLMMANAFVQSRGRRILELPTGQGLLWT